MVYRSESDEDVALGYSRPGSDRSALAAGSPRLAGPSRSRFPTPSLPPPARAAGPAVDVGPDPATTRPTVPVSQAVPGAPVRPPASAAPTPPAQVVGTAPPDLPRSDDGKRGGRAWQVLCGAAVLVLLAVCGLAAAAVLQDPTRAPQAADPTTQPEGEQSVAPGGSDLDSRDTDQLALAAKEVFPDRTLVVTDGQPAYQVLRTQSSASCAVAATGEVGDLLVRLGCNQVVRATLRSPDGKHLLTAGLFNLTDVASAQRARDRLRQLLDERQGRFRGMETGADTEVVSRAAARVGWQVRGHYLAYCLVTRADGEPISANDAAAREILYDMIELHLNREVLDRRANSGVASQPTVAPTGGTAGQEGAGNGREPSGN